MPVVAWAQGSQPVVDGVTIVSTPHNGSAYVFGETISVKVSFDQAVTVPIENYYLTKLTLMIGTQARKADFNQTTSGNDDLTFDYFVQYADRDADASPSPQTP